LLRNNDNHYILNNPV